MQKPLILVTNDDGISSKGIRVLINIAREYGEVLVVAPDSPQSGKSHSITQEKTIQFHLIAREEGYAEYSCSGTPVDAVKIAVHEICDNRRPDIVLSGINHGANTSINVIYSGTMGAAIEGTFNGMHSVGFSLCEYGDDIDFSHTVPFIKQIVEDVITNGLPKDISLNVNFPAANGEPLKGLKVARGTTGVWNEKFYSANHPHGMKAFWMSGDFTNFEPHAEDTDLYVISHNYGSVVPTKVDFNAYEQINTLKNRLEK